MNEHHPAGAPLNIQFDPDRSPVAEIAEHGAVRWLNGENVLPVGTKLFARAAPGGRSEVFAVPEWLHPRTADLVARFAAALADKLAEAERKYGYTDGWADAAWIDECRAQLVHHVAKGDPRDVAAYCAFLWHHGQSTAAGADRDEEKQSAWREFEGDYLTDGNGYAPASTYAACSEAFNSAWPEGEAAALRAAESAFRKAHPSAERTACSQRCECDCIGACKKGRGGRGAQVPAIEADAETDDCRGSWIQQIFRPLPDDEVAALRAVGAPGFEADVQRESSRIVPGWTVKELSGNHQEIGIVRESDGEGWWVGRDNGAYHFLRAVLDAAQPASENPIAAAGLADDLCIAVYDAVSRSNITRDVKTPEKKVAVVTEAIAKFGGGK